MKTLMFIPIWLFTLSAHALTNGLALLPPMGWNTWYCFVDVYDDAMIRGVTDAMVTNGLQAAGYQYINLDGCYWFGRDTNGNMLVDTNRFPSGISGLAAYVRAKGFKFGIYADTSTYPSLCRVPAPPSYGLESNDVASFVQWGVDFLKIDFLGAPGPGTTESAQSISTRWLNLLRASNRPMLLSLSGGYIEGWKPDVGNMFRISGDINVTWEGVTNNLNLANRSARFAGPGHWNDPDMIFIGVNSNLSDIENRAFFSLWCITASPLILSTDVRSMTPATKAIVTAPELIAVDQDPLGAQGIRVSSVEASGGNLEVWCKPLAAANARAVALFNQSSSAADITVTWTNLLLQAGPAMVRDLWARADLGVFTNSLTTNVPSHGAVVLKIIGNPLGPPVFLSTLSNRTVTGTVNFDRSSTVTYYRFPVLSLNNILYPRGIEMEPPASVTYDLSSFAGDAMTFVADIGIDIDSQGFGSAIFQVWADGVKMLERGPITATTVAETIMIDVSGRQSLQLTTLGSGYADWADARILVWSRPQLTDIARQPDGALKISGADAAGRRGVLLAATNLSSPTLWSAVATNTADDYGTLSFPAQPTTNHPQRFFRLQRP